MNINATTWHKIILLEKNGFTFISKLYANDILEGLQPDMVKSSVLTVYPKKYAHGFVVLCFVVVIQDALLVS